VAEPSGNPQGLPHATRTMHAGKDSPHQR